MDDSDGDLSNVNPDLLKLCANAEDWKEQRRRAMKAKIFGSGGGGTSAHTNVGAYLPSENIVGPSPSSTTVRVVESQQASEAYILRQILSRKRRHEEVNQQLSDAGATSYAGAQQQQHQEQRQSDYSLLENQQQQEYQQQQRQQQPSLSGRELSLKEKLMRKYSKS